MGTSECVSCDGKLVLERKGSSESMDHLEMVFFAGASREVAAEGRRRLEDYVATVALIHWLAC